MVDIDNQSPKNLNFRIWDYHILIKKFLSEENCLLGRKTFDLVQWKGPKCWVLTRNKKWKKTNVGTIHDLDDLHLHIDGPLYVLGGDSLFKQLEEYVDEMHMYTLNAKGGHKDFLYINLESWKPANFKNKDTWSYVHLKKINTQIKD